jgi:hypothetical protein
MAQKRRFLEMDKNRSSGRYDPDARQNCAMAPSNVSEIGTARSSCCNPMTDKAYMRPRGEKPLEWSAW